MVAGTCLRTAARMVMGKNDRGSIARECGLHHFMRIDAGMGKRPPEHFLFQDQVVLLVEIQDNKEFVVKPGTMQFEPGVEAPLCRDGLPRILDLQQDCAGQRYEPPVAGAIEAQHMHHA